MSQKRKPNSGSFGHGSPYTRLPVDPSMLDQVLELINRNLTAREIAEAVGRSRRTVLRYYRILREDGRIGYLQEIHSSPTPEQLSKALVLLKDGSGYDEAARTVGLSSKTVAKHLPGFALTPGEVIERARLGRIMASIPNTL